MAFEQAPTRTPIGRGAMSIVLYVPDPTKPDEVQDGRLSVQIFYSDGTLEETHFDLLARLQDDAEGETHLSNLVSLRDYLIDRVDDEVISA